MNKLVILTPVLYRGYLHRTIASIASQGLDHIIINDSDIPLEIKRENVLVLDNGRNMGVGYSFDRGVEKALELGYNRIGIVAADSMISPKWLEEITKVLEQPNVVGVCGVALNPNQKQLIARVKFLLKEYERRGRLRFSNDCSIFKAEVFEYANFGGRRIAEDSYFLSFINPDQLKIAEKAISYHHEVESVRLFFWKEIVGALYSLSQSLAVARNFLLTPWTCMKMIRLRNVNRDYPATSLVWLLRQIIWTIAYAIGRISGY